MERCFNIAGPCFPDEHYMLPALERLPGIMRIVEQRSCFVLPAQAGLDVKALLAQMSEYSKSRSSCSSTRTRRNPGTRRYTPGTLRSTARLST